MHFYYLSGPNVTILSKTEYYVQILDETYLLPGLDSCNFFKILIHFLGPGVQISKPEHCIQSVARRLFNLILIPHTNFSDCFNPSYQTRWISHVFTPPS